MTTPKNSKDDGVDIHLSWPVIVKLLPWFLLLLFGGGAIGNGLGILSVAPAPKMQKRMDKIEHEHVKYLVNQAVMQTDIEYIKKQGSRIEDHMKNIQHELRNRRPPR